MYREDNLPQAGQKVRISPFSAIRPGEVRVVLEVFSRSHHGNGWAPNPLSYHAYLEGMDIDVPVDILFPVEEA